jgi:hypothetical protein
MFHRQAFRQVGAIEGPGIDHLPTAGVDDLDLLASSAKWPCLAGLGW